jgi:peptidoglycan L-alanyl-D-glutamate endopeptidase CwlK
MRNLNERSFKNLVGVHPNLVKVLERAIVESPLGFTVVCGVRTIAEQQELYAKGRTKPGLVVTNCDGIKNRSNHQVHSDGYGYAVDLYADANGNDKVDAVEINDIPSLRIVAKTIKDVAKSLNINVEWGGDWQGKLIDYPHFEMKN